MSTLAETAALAYLALALLLFDAARIACERVAGRCRRVDALAAWLTMAQVARVIYDTQGHVRAVVLDSAGGSHTTAGRADEDRFRRGAEDQSAVGLRT